MSEELTEGQLVKSYFQQVKMEPIKALVHQIVDKEIELNENEYANFVKEQMKKKNFKALTKEKKKVFFKECGRLWKESKKATKEDTKEESCGKDHQIGDKKKNLLANKKEDCGEPGCEKKKKKPLEEKTGDKAEYQKYFKKMLKKYGVKNQGELKGDQKKKFHDELDAGWKGDNEKD